MEFGTIVQKRYATKLFDGRKIPQEKTDKLLELIRHAPSSFNIQPWKIVIVTDQKLKEQLKEAAWNQPQVTSCSHLLVFCGYTDIKGNIDKLGEAMISAGAKKDDISGYMQMMYDFEKSLTPEQKLSWSQRQLYLALANALLGAKSLGFDSCPMEGFDSAQFAKILELPSTIVPTALCAIGYAADTPKPKLRFAKEDVFVRV